MLTDEFVNRNRLDFFRLHYQFIMANDKRAPYDYFMLVVRAVAGDRLGAGPTGRTRPVCCRWRGGADSSRGLMSFVRIGKAEIVILR